MARGDSAKCKMLVTAVLLTLLKLIASVFTVSGLGLSRGAALELISFGVHSIHISLNFLYTK